MNELTIAEALPIIRKLSNGTEPVCNLAIEWLERFDGSTPAREVYHQMWVDWRVWLAQALGLDWMYGHSVSAVSWGVYHEKLSDALHFDMSVQRLAQTAPAPDESPRYTLYKSFCTLPYEMIEKALLERRWGHSHESAK